MARPFKLTARSLENDHLKPVMMILTLATLILGGWNIWFFFGKISVYETSIDAQLADRNEIIIPSFSGPGRVEKHRQNQIIASFPMNVKHRIYLGQKGLFFPDVNQGKLNGVIDAMVSKIVPNVEKNIIQVTLKTTQPFQNYIPMQSNTTGKIKIEIDQVTPFKHVLSNL